MQVSVVSLHRFITCSVGFFPPSLLSRVQPNHAPRRTCSSREIFSRNRNPAPGRHIINNLLFNVSSQFSTRWRISLGAGNNNCQTYAIEFKEHSSGRMHDRPVWPAG